MVSTDKGKDKEKKELKANRALETARAATEMAKPTESKDELDAASTMRSTIELAKTTTQMKALELANKQMEKMISDGDDDHDEKQNKKMSVSKEDTSPGIVQLIKALDPDTQREVMQKLIGDNSSELYDLLGPKRPGGVLGLASQRQVQQPVNSPASELKTLAEAMGITAENRTNNESSSMQNFLTMLQVIKELQNAPAPQPIQAVSNPQNDAMLTLLAKMGDAIVESNRQTKEMIVTFQAKLANPAPAQENSIAEKYLQMAMDAQKAVEVEKDKRHADQLDNILQRQAERDAAYQKQLENISKVSAAGLDNRGGFQQMAEEFKKWKDMGQSISGDTNVEIEKAKIDKETKIELAKIELEKMKMTSAQTQNEAAQKKAARGAWEGAASKLVDTFINLSQQPPQAIEPAPVTPIAKNILGSRTLA
jgi:hypothetical protein